MSKKNKKSKKNQAKSKKTTNTTKEIMQENKEEIIEDVANTAEQKEEKAVETIEGQPPSITDKIEGCPFAPRCERCMEICTKTYPETRCFADGSKVQCHLYDLEPNT